MQVHGNVIIFGFDRSLSSHADNRKNNFLISGGSPTYGINGSSGSPEKRFSLNFTKANAMFCLSLHYNADDNYLFVNGKEILNLKLAIKMLTLQLIFFSEVFLMDLVLLNLEKYL